MVSRAVSAVGELLAEKGSLCRGWMGAVEDGTLPLCLQPFVGRCPSSSFHSVARSLLHLRSVERAGGVLS